MMAAPILAALLGVVLPPTETARPRSAQPYTSVLVVPTGIGAAIGGYAGDALPVARAFCSVADRVITHPNVMNGAQMYWPDPKLLYTEGFALDELAAGRLGLRPATSQRVGLLLDAAIEPELRMRHLQAADAARATLGLGIAAHTTTDEPVGVEIDLSPAGASYGTVRRPEVLLSAAKRLLAAGCTAIAVVARFPDDEDEAMLAAYRAGAGVDAIGGAEAIISHLITQQLKVPCAHAPALPALDLEPELSPRACAEELGHTFLPCVLVNLARAPSLLSETDRTLPGDIWASDIDSIVVPAGACGGPAVLSLLGERALVVAVEENECALDVRAEALRAKGVLVVRSYMEALGLLAAHKAGINPASLTANIASIKDLEV
tara:strand:+ start:4858 stop:5988 length:1131 start_codon:yes stop_codon:yes gene_type:complete